MRADVNGITLAYEERGIGSPLLLIHGFPHSRALWRPQLDALASDHRCIAPDLRGFGESGVAPPYTMDRYADDLAALLDVLDVERCAVAGLSMGGYVAFALWRRHRARISALILADTRAESDDAAGREKRVGMIEMARTKGMDAVAEAMITAMVGKTTRESNPALLQEVRAMLSSAPTEGAIGALEAMMNRPDSTSLLAGIDVPTLLIVGGEDTLTPPEFAQTMHDAIPGSTLAEIPRAGHVSNLEQPMMFNTVVRDLLQSLQPG